MTSSLRRKHPITRRSILRWMQDSLYLSVGLSFAWGACFCQAGEVTAPKSRTTSAGRAAVDTKPTTKGVGRSKIMVLSVGPASVKAPASPPKSAKKTTRPAARIIRAQNEVEPVASDFEEEPVTLTAGEVVPPPAAIPEPKAPQADAIQRLRDRSAKARWDELHQEWLRARKQRQAQAEEVLQQPPAAEQATEGATSTDNPFESEASAAGAKIIPPSSNVRDAATGEGVTAPNVAPGRVFLQSQQNQVPQLQGETEAQARERLRLDLEAQEALKVDPPVRDPSAMPKISEINPNPVDWALPAGRPVPELDAKRYVQLGAATYTPRVFPEFTYSFEATNVYSNPLYFEDPTLERYGHTLPPLIQPVASVARFGGQVALFPYQVAMKPLCAKIYPLGWYGPGEYVPYRLYQLPLNPKAVAAEVGTILGVGYVTP